MTQYYVTGKRREFRPRRVESRTSGKKGVSRKEALVRAQMMRRRGYYDIKIKKKR